MVDWKMVIRFLFLNRSIENNWNITKRKKERSRQKEKKVGFYFYVTENQFKKQASHWTVSGDCPLKKFEFEIIRYFLLWKHSKLTVEISWEKGQNS